MGVKCFFVKPAGRARRNLRRYCPSDSAEAKCPGHGYHNANGPLLDIVTDAIDTDTRLWTTHQAVGADPPHDDARWPRKCDHCDYAFTEADPFQIFVEHIYVDENGGEHTLRDETPGMMWDAFWMGEWSAGPDGLHLCVNCPNGRQWLIDGPASNCTDPKDSGPFGVAHRCWNRSGTPPLISVGKGPGKTCGAGGGSIQAGDYHGFLGSQGAPPGEFT